MPMHTHSHVKSEVILKKLLSKWLECLESSVKLSEQ